MNNTTLKMSQQEIMYEMKYAWSRQKPIRIRFLENSQETTSQGKIFGIDYDLLYIKEGNVVRRIALDDILSISM
ncbi:hypothetical protein F4V47_05345 [Lactococcus garvieae subsp. garvieae]|uniref:hypothetical protein n=1 Tax=Lactococcus garvieae TaxID=1363 RepID=UPI0005A721B6|nr:hypothetical protein [Lactococcus garvieae]KAA8713768.1 hypothetical protein F4V47_05345 [Lactococcus garvieae subsp. garvieae]MCI3860433.1 hypothetical protein [Lactococcus garvieae]MDG6190428.1 hypothetical protein [Lactococcus garvieae]QPR48316.1 hypothetical protein I6G86_06995 [Lactococcus garvieae]